LGNEFPMGHLRIIVTNAKKTGIDEKKSGKISFF
jgi:hypothetical protein